MIVDFHSHILPELDDGSSSLEESVGMLRAEAAQGIDQVVATPHFYARYDDLSGFLKRRAEAERCLREEMKKYPGLPQLHIGAEVRFFRGMSHSDRLSALTIDRKDCILIEMPALPWTETMYQELEMIYSRQGLTPVIAHVDRYMSALRTHHIPERLAELPVLIQANSGFFTAWKTRTMALKMLMRDQIHLLGSDCHHLVIRKPDLGEAVDVIRRRLGEGALEQIRYYQDRVLDNSKQ